MNEINPFSPVGMRQVAEAAEKMLRDILQGEKPTAAPQIVDRMLTSLFIKASMHEAKTADLHRRLTALESLTKTATKGRRK